MRPKLAQSVDPIFLHVLELLDQVGRDIHPNPQEERIRIRALLDQAEALIGVGQEWDLCKYALASWIDEMLVDSAWDAREWWSNNVLEMELFNTRLCFEQFFVRAQEAAGLSRRDALEVYYVCVVMGFRGMYRDAATSAVFAQSHGLPLDLATWAKQTAMSIRLGQGRPPMRGPRREILGAPPLRKRSHVIWPWFAATLLGVCSVIYYYWFNP